ncbi:MAG TPA: DUF58 domain-containing protein [Vicinamibacterales bacterium]|nr:DUF58 domain-containing protein [Vicinamibacterales bacterium]
MPLRFQDDFLRRLGYLRVIATRDFAGRNRADRRTRRRGRGIEFADHRPYVPGDDVRHIDWKAYNRLRRLLILLFEEERDLPIYLTLDLSASMAEPRKFELARQVVAAVCYIGLAHLDRVRVLAFSGGKLVQELAPGRGKGRIFGVFQMLDALQPGGPTNLRDAFKTFVSRPRPAGLVVVVSDFLDPAGFEQALKILHTRGHDVAVVHIASALDRDPSAFGEVRVVDAESGEWRELDVTPRLAAAHARAWDEHAEHLARFCARYGLKYIRADVGRPIEDLMLKGFRQGRVVE